MTAVTTGYDCMVLCETNYTSNPAPRLPGINTFRERCDMWLLKKFDPLWLYTADSRLGSRAKQLCNDIGGIVNRSV